MIVFLSRIWSERWHKYYLKFYLTLVMSLFCTGIAHGQKSGLTLRQAFRLCLQNPQILAGRESVKQARAEAKTASLFSNPSLSVEGGLFPLSRQYTIDEPGGPTEFCAGLSYPIDPLLFGKRSAAKASAEMQISVAVAEFMDIIRRRTMETAQAFYGVLEAEALLKLAKQEVEHLEQIEAAIRKAVASGGRPQVELHRVRLELLSARRNQRTAQFDVIKEKTSLQALLGQKASVNRLLVSGTLDAPLTEKPLSSAAAYAFAAEHRPDVVALRKKAAVAQKDIILEGRNALPETTLGFNVTHQFQRAIGAPDVTAWGASLEISLPILDRNQGNRAKAASAAAQNTYELEAALLDLHGEVEQAVQSLPTAKENASAVAQSELVQASQVRDSYIKAYEAGGRSLVEMLDGYRKYFETYRVYISSRTDYWRALYGYYASIGKKVIP